MDKKTLRIVVLCSIGLSLFLGVGEYSNGFAVPAFYRMFRAKYGWAGGCNICHVSKKGGDARNLYGQAFLHNGMNPLTFDRIANEDSDKDGYSNIDEIKARSYPGDASSTPKNTSASEGAGEGGSLEGGIFDFGGAATEETGESNTGLLGAFGNLTFGGALDVRRLTSGGDLVPDHDNWQTGKTVVHVAELVVTTNVGDHISLLGEQLLVTSLLGTQVADDHGFVYAIVTGVPVLPKGASLKIGRFRHAYGIDAQSDAPANPLYNLVRKNIGFISDRGIQLNGFAGPISYTVSLADGPEALRLPAEGSTEGGASMGGHGGGGGILQPIQNNSPPVFVRLSGSLPILGKRIGLGASYFDGNSYPFNPMNGDVDQSTLVYKRRFSGDAKFKLWRLDIAGEYTRGQDVQLLKYIDHQAEQGVHLADMDRKSTVEGYYLHAELPLTSTLDVRIKYDLWNPDTGRYKTLKFDRDEGDEVWTTLGGALTWHFTEGAFARIVYQVDNVEKPSRSGEIIPQLLVEY